jgi:hypothetical protein
MVAHSTLILLCTVSCESEPSRSYIIERAKTVDTVSSSPQEPSLLALQNVLHYDRWLFTTATTRTTIYIKGFLSESQHSKR